MPTLHKTPGTASKVIFCLLASVLSASSAARAESSLPALESCTQFSDETLLITRLDVTEHVIAKADGPLSFKRMIESSTRPPIDPRTTVETWLGKWGESRLVNGHVVPAANVDEMLLYWPKEGPAANQDRIALDRAPFRLLAVLPRLDLRRVDAEAGELRFVFGAFDPNTLAPRPLTIIFEFLVAGSPEVWAERWMRLAQISDADRYRSELVKLVDLALVSRLKGDAHSGARVIHPPIGQIRTNDFVMMTEWDLREFHWSEADLGFVAMPVARTPAEAFRSSRGSELVEWINANSSAITVGEVEMPREFLGGHALVPHDNFRWLVDAGVSEDARKAFSLATCSGCHSGETDTRFLHIEPRWSTQPPVISEFLRREIPIRGKDLVALACRSGQASAEKRPDHDVH